MFEVFFYCCFLKKRMKERNNLSIVWIFRRVFYFFYLIMVFIRTRIYKTNKQIQIIIQKRPTITICPFTKKEKSSISDLVIIFKEEKYRRNQRTSPIRNKYHCENIYIIIWCWINSNMLCACVRVCVCVSMLRIWPVYCVYQFGIHLI